LVLGEIRRGKEKGRKRKKKGEKPSSNKNTGTTS